jgi:hypothetical protein
MRGSAALILTSLAVLVLVAFAEPAAAQVVNPMPSGGTGATRPASEGTTTSVRAPSLLDRQIAALRVAWMTRAWAPAFGARAPRATPTRAKRTTR